MAQTLEFKQAVSQPNTNRERQKTDNFLSRLILRFRAKRQAKKILKAIGQADKIHSGKQRGKSYDEFLKEL